MIHRVIDPGAVNLVHIPVIQQGSDGLSYNKAVVELRELDWLLRTPFLPFIDHEFLKY